MNSAPSTLPTLETPNDARPSNSPIQASSQAPKPIEPTATRDRLETPAMTPVSTPSGAKGPALNRLPKLPFEFFLLLAVVLLLLGAFAVMTRLSLSDAQSDAERTGDELATASASLGELETTNAELVATNEVLDARVAQLERDAADAAVAVPEPTPSPAPAPTDDIDDLTDQVDDLTDEIERLEAANADLQDAVEGAEAVDGEDVPVPAVVASPSDSAAFTQWVGEVLASEDGIRIDALQATCLGAYVLDDIGFDAVGVGMRAGRTTPEHDVVIESMFAALAECGLEANRVFGS